MDRNTQTPDLRNYRTALAALGTLALATASTVLALQSVAYVSPSVGAAGSAVDSAVAADSRRSASTTETSNLVGEDRVQIAGSGVGLPGQSTDFGVAERNTIAGRVNGALEEVDRARPSAAVQEPIAAVSGTESADSLAGHAGGQQPDATAPDVIANQADENDEVDRPNSDPAHEADSDDD